MKRYIVFCAVVATGCEPADPLPEEQLLPLLHADFEVPECASFDLNERSWGNHTRTDRGYEETIYFEGSSECLDQWLLSANGLDADDDVPADFFVRDGTGYRMIMRLNREAAPNRDRVFIQWLHHSPIDDVDYVDVRTP